MPDLFRLDGHVAVVTGALGKLGPMWTEALLDAGARVVALDRPGAKSPDFDALKNLHGERLQLHHADIRDRAALEAARDAASKRLGPITVLVNNAGIDQPPAAGAVKHKLEEIPLDVCREILDVNVLGLFLATQVFGAGMCARRRGSIVNIGSLYTGVSPDAKFYDHIPGFLKPPAYGASKAAVVQLTKYFAAHWGPHGVRVNTLSPGGILGGQDRDFQRKFSERVPLGRLGAPDELKGPLVFLASDASSYVTGAELKIDGGFTAW